MGPSLSRSARPRCVALRSGSYIHGAGRGFHVDFRYVPIQRTKPDGSQFYFLPESSQQMHWRIISLSRRLGLHSHTGDTRLTNFDDLRWCQTLNEQAAKVYILWAHGVKVKGTYCDQSFLRRQRLCKSWGALLGRVAQRFPSNIARFGVNQTRTCKA